MKFLLILTILNCAFGHNIQRQRFAGRIIDGATTFTGQFPYLVSLESDKVHYCGGSIINPTNILTAARCVDGMYPYYIVVYAGDNRLNNTGVKIPGLTYTMHQNYDPNKEVNDIAIIGLTGPLEYSTTIQPIQVDPTDIKTGVQCVMSGWGTIMYPGEEPSLITRYLNLNVSDLNDCKRIHGENRITCTNICAMSQTGQGNCMYDAGGALVADGKQIGIASWFKPCGSGEPDVYTRVSFYVDWIKVHLITFPPEI